MLIRKYRLAGLAAVLMSAALAAGCGKQEPAAAQEAGREAAAAAGEEVAGGRQDPAAGGEVPASGQKSGQAGDGAATSGGGAADEAPAEIVIETESSQPVPSDAGGEDPASSFSFGDAAGREFYFSSGAGAWYTVVHIHEDGTFEGHYQDSDMGDRADAYPNGTLYYSDFSGSFTQPERIDDYTVAFQIASIEYTYGSGEEIRDGCHYVYSTAYGLDGAKDLYLYLPGMPVSQLPENYKNWVRYELGDSTELPFYGLYNVETECGFSSHQVERASARIAAVLSTAEENAAAAEETLQRALTQTDLNLAAGDVYQVWDDALNTIWGILKETLNEEDMQALTAEERDWIRQKENTVQEAAAEYEGGTIVPMVSSQTAAHLTRERVYELARRYGEIE